MKLNINVRQRNKLIELNFNAITEKKKLLLQFLCGIFEIQSNGIWRNEKEKKQQFTRER